MSEPAGTVRRWVPRNLQDHGMILASEVAHYTHLSLVQYVLASDYDLLAKQARELATAVDVAMWLVSVPDHMQDEEWQDKYMELKIAYQQAQAVLDAQGRRG